MELLNPLVLAEYLETEASETFPSQDAARSVQKAIDAAEYTIAGEHPATPARTPRSRSRSEVLVRSIGSHHAIRVNS